MAKQGHGVFLYSIFGCRKSHEFRPGAILEGRDMHSLRSDFEQGQYYE